MRMNAKKLLDQHSPHKWMSKSSTGYSLAARMGLVNHTIHTARHEDDVEHESGELYIHISMIVNVFFFKVPIPDG